MAELALPGLSHVLGSLKPVWVYNYIPLIYFNIDETCRWDSAQTPVWTQDPLGDSACSLGSSVTEAPCFPGMKRGKVSRVPAGMLGRGSKPWEIDVLTGNKG